MLRALLLLPLLAAPAAAQVTRLCEGFEASAANVVWESPSPTFARGAIRLVHLDTGGEPVCCSSHLMVLHPSPPPERFADCTLVSRRGRQGWSWLHLDAVEATYDPATGLDLLLPAILFEEGAAGRPVPLRLRVDQARGTVTIR